MPLLHAEIGPTPGSQPVTPVFAAADLVCNCFVKSLSVVEEPIEAGEKSAIRRHVTASIEIRDSYKSEGLGNQVVLLEYVQDEQLGRRIAGARQRLLEGETVLLFLKATRPGIYSFADPFLGATPFSLLPQQPEKAGIVKLQHVLVVVARGTNRGDRIKALRLLQGFDSFDQDSLASLDPLRNSVDPEIALTTIGVLLKTKTPESVEHLKNYLDAYTGESEPLALVSIGTELGQINNAKALPTMEALSHSKYVSIRWGAMDAMRLMKNPKSAATLVGRLDDPDSTIQYLAVITLAEILGKYDGDYAPTMNLFDKKPRYYIQLWKQWWAQNGSRIDSVPEGF
jgi:hypothetical protein